MTPYLHTWFGNNYAAGFEIPGHKFGHSLKFGQTEGAYKQATMPIKGNIVGFKVVMGGNVDYWGLIVA